jgi:DNA replication protein
LSTCNYIHEHHNVVLLGATGSGKTYIACALGMAAARNFLKVKYVRLPELLVDLSIARSEGTYRKVIAQYKKPPLLIIDEWLLYPLKETEARDLLEITESRYKKASTIFCSQFDVPGWREMIGDPILGDAVCDRIAHDSYSIVIDCKDSMRKRKGIVE